MAETPSRICDPRLYGLSEALEQAKENAAAFPGFEHVIARYLHTQCQLSPISLPPVLRGLEILGGILEGGGPETRLLTMLRPFLLSSNPRIASKAVLVVGRQWKGMSWLKAVLGKSDGRVRANLIEALWNRDEPEIEMILRQAAKDRNPRVAANAICGLYFLNNSDWREALARMIESRSPAFRRSGIWVLKRSGARCAHAQLKLLIRDSDPGVRHAAFDALIHLRKTNGGKMPAPEELEPHGLESGVLEGAP